MAPTYLSPGVYVEEVDKGSKPIAAVGTAVAAFLGFAKNGPLNTPTLVTNWSQYVEHFGDFMEGSYLAHSVYGYFNNGGGRCYIVRIGAEGEVAPEAPAQLPAAAMAALPSRAGTHQETLRITARGTPEEARGITIEVAAAGSPVAEGESAEVAPSATSEEFKLIVHKPGQEDEVFDNLTFRRGRTARNVETVLNDANTGSKLILVQDLGLSLSMPERMPVTGTYNLVVTSVAAPSPAPAGSLKVSPRDFIGSAPERTGMGGLEVPEDVTMLCLPDLMAAYQQGIIDEEAVQAVQTAMINHCESTKDRVAILDCPPGLKPQQMENWRSRVNYDSSYATLYYPWIRVFDPLSGKNIMMPPSGHMAGVWARNDASRGVQKAPANEVVSGAVDVEFQITRGEQDGLNPKGINCIRAFPGRGIRVWGARTLSSDPSWTYLNVRRLFNMIEKSVDNGTQWVVFEPNDFALWQRIVRTVSAFLTMQWRAGALFGATPAAAFYVKCDSETNPPEARDLGMVTTEIGIAPVKPAEFVIFRITQWQPEA